MARLDVYPSPGRVASGFVVDVQSDLLSHLATRVVVPLLPETTIRAPVTRLNPIFEIDGQRHILLAQSIATVPRRELRGAVASLKDERDTVLAAIDFLLTGF
jgi:toxin CcdB